jgi:hypothetical protein
MLALHDLFYQIILMFVSFLRYTIVGCVRRTSGRGSEGSTPLDITAMVHIPVVQSKPAINLSVIN